VKDTQSKNLSSRKSGARKEARQYKACCHAAAPTSLFIQAKDSKRGSFMHIVTIVASGAEEDKGGNDGEATPTFLGVLLTTRV